jgi:hypothetical protein
MYFAGSDHTARLNVNPLVVQPGQLQASLKCEGLVFFSSNAEKAACRHNGAGSFLRGVLLDWRCKATIKTVL